MFLVVKTIINKDGVSEAVERLTAVLSLFSGRAEALEWEVESGGGMGV
jgi:hypothetical protein